MICGFCQRPFEGKWFIFSGDTAIGHQLVGKPATYVVIRQHQEGKEVVERK